MHTFSVLAMDLAHIRQRASALHLGEINDSEYLQEVVDFIVRHKNQLPENISHPLREAFGRQSSQKSAPLRNRQDALDRVRCVTREDIKSPEYLRDVFPLYEEQGYLFWTGEISSSTKRVFQNVLSDLYYANQRGTIANSVRRAFYCVALYRVIQRIMKLHGCKTFTSNIALFCAEMILRDSSFGTPQSEDDIVQELKSDYKIGCVYEPYAQREGSGIFFYLFVLPPNLYEKYLNKTDDVDTVLSHYKSTGFQQESSARSAAASIMGVITDRFDSQVSIFRLDSNVPHCLITPTRKRSQCTKVQTKPSSKRVKKARRANLSSLTELLPLREEGPEETVAEITYVTDKDSNRPNPPNQSTNSQLSHSLTGDSGIPVPFGDPAGCLGESNSHTGSPRTVINAEAVRVDRRLEPTVVTSKSFQPSTDVNGSQNSSLAFSMNTASNAARLMDEFQLESMFDEINAAQLMQDFHVENFNLADNVNASQLMQQFDWFDGQYSLQNM